MSASQKIEEGTATQLQFDKSGGLLPVIVQDHETNQILMLGYTNPEAYNYSVKHKRAAFWSRSRNSFWVKGETSGNTLHIKEVLVDCDQDALIYKVSLDGEGACHTKNKNGEFRRSCFYRSLNSETQQLDFIEE